MLKRGLSSILIALLALSAQNASYAQTTWHVDEDCAPPGKGTESDPFCTIQGGVNASSDGDIVLVAPGTYTGEGNQDISVFGKAITVRAADGLGVTTIDIQGGPDSIHRGFFLIHGETPDTIIEGFTIINGYLIGDTGGSGPAGGGGGAGIYIRNSSPTVRGCNLTNNTSATLGQAFVDDGRGGAFYIDGNSDASFESCFVLGNIADRMGGGMYIGYANSNVTIKNLLVAGNSAGAGAGIYNTFGATTISDTALTSNSAVYTGGAFVSENSDAVLSNCILWGNGAPEGHEISFSCPRLPSIEFSNVQGAPESVHSFCGLDLIWGGGNIDADPLFFDPENGDYHLLDGSPCIDAGNNMAVPHGVVADLDGLARFADDPGTVDTGNGGLDVGIVDMGSYEFGAEDCNNNGTLDVDETAAGDATDCDDNSIPDECQPDCNENGQADTCDLTDETSTDCDNNANPDECDSDCNTNGIPDACDIADETSGDCNGNAIPDECEPDCNDSGQPDDCDVADGSSEDCNADGLPDECVEPLPIVEQPQDQHVEEGELAIFSVVVDGVLLEYQWRKDGVELVDSERILGSQSSLLIILEVVPEDAGEYDCVISNVTDCSNTSDTATLTVHGPCPEDINDDGLVGPVDLAMLLGAWGPCADPDACPADLNADATVDPIDLATLLGAWGPCP